MSGDVTELYQEVILDHAKAPRNFGELEGATHVKEGYNPLCGDRYRIMLRVKDGKVEEAAFTGDGCAISKASTSLMTTAVRGLSVSQAEELFTRVHELLTNDEAEAGPELGKLVVFSGVRGYPMRVKCASLAWHTLVSALRGEDEPVTTE